MSRRSAQTAAAPGPIGAQAVLPVRRRWLLLVAVAALALVVRLAFLWGQWRHNPLFAHPVMDGLVHHEWAAQIARGDGMGRAPYFRAPLYYYFLGGLYALFSPHPAVARIAGAVLGACTSALVARLGLRLGGPGTAVLAGTLAALYWPLIYYETEPLTVGLELLLNVALLIALLSVTDGPHAWRYLTAGLLWGLSAITRPNVLAVAPGVAAWLWFLTPREKRARRWLQRCALLACGGALPVLPVTIRNYLVSGEFVLIASQGGVNFYIGNNPHSDGFTAVVPGTRPTWWGGFVDSHRIAEQQLGRPLSEAEVSRYWYARAWEWIAAEPDAWLAHLLHKLRLFWSHYEIPNNQPIWFFARTSEISALFWIGFPLVAPLALAATVFVFRRPQGWSLLAVFFVLYMATVVLFFCPARFRLPVVPILIVAAAAGVFEMLAAMGRRELLRVGAWGLSALLAAVFIQTNPPDRRDFDHQSEAEGHFILGLHAWRGAESTPQDAARAAGHFRLAVRLRPQDADAWLYLGRALLVCGERSEAEAGLAAAVKVGPQNPDAHLGYAMFLESTGRTADALSHFQEAIRLRPTFVEARHGLARSLLGLRREAEALEQLRPALELEPESVPVRLAVGLALARLGRYEESLVVYDEVLRREPGHTNARHQRGNVLARLGRIEEAIPVFEGLLSENPRHSSFRFSLQQALRDAGRFAEAMTVCREGLGEPQEDVRLLQSLAWMLATCPQDDLRRGQEALLLASRANRLAGQPVAEILDALAAAHAECGQFELALEKAQQALRLARENQQDALAGLIEQRVRLYELGRPYRLPDPRASSGEQSRPVRP